MNSKQYYITTTLPYVNAEPHIGFALEILEADCLARYHTKPGDEVKFNFGTDEHGQKIYEKALQSKKEPQAYVDEYALKFDHLKQALNLSYNHFIRTTNPDHIKAAQHFWTLCQKNGYIDLKDYEAKYCVGCELEKTDSELENNICPLHPNQPIQILKEKNYFFKFSAFQKPLLDFYKKNPDFVVPSFRFNEIIQFVQSGLNDFSISRLKSKMPWGIEVPGDPDHVMYVWFDALINYISTLGWPNKDISSWWPGIQIAGKDNLRQQSAIWQAMLMAAGLPNTKQIFIHGFISVNGQKISKSLGNTISPYDLVEKYGTDPVRYFLLAKVNPYEDSDFSIEKFEDAYNSDLANNLGNLVSRVAKLCESNNIELQTQQPSKNNLDTKINANLNAFRFDLALESIWTEINDLNKYLSDTKPWTLTNDQPTLTSILTSAVIRIREIAISLKPFLPETSKKILEEFNKTKIKSISPLFPRIK
ncbi:methionine--tRNA ligase [Candidatus Woesebacteria bacterium RIFOXYB1_FULL_38_16]|uniref:Methionine--tRNA ligase n=1 Tax=Candidatus Woesebacteria bacterium RIFOXYB1_FULL_38_16 TaxID=1802538 RepID=A0A1F8CW72_9BACT|nr:MAG: methionine--tRNA ligase [Candidatus Woesebacteria bacterium RIFOXYA1_FULL_38_9]OGM79978.1 MAG: methionine--tRNA ligase [Candidatus Woesebacteria bacterium RIFOXYB1_FULL_38_16]